MPLRHHLFRGVVPRAVPPSLDEIDFRLRRGVVVGETTGDHGCEKWTPCNLPNARRTELQPLQVRLVLNECFGFIVRKATNRNITHAGSAVQACRKPCTISFKA